MIRNAIVTLAAGFIAFTVTAGPSLAADVNSAVFGGLADTAPRSVFDQLSEAAPRSVHDQLSDSAPRSIFADIEQSAPNDAGDRQITVPAAP